MSVRFVLLLLLLLLSHVITISRHRFFFTFNITDTWEDFNITCREDLYELNNTCLPHCDKLEGNPHTASLTMVVSEEVAVTIGVLACLIIIIPSIKDYKTMEAKIKHHSLMNTLI